MDDVQVTFSGMNELVESLENLTRKYPDKAGELLQKDAKELRKEVVKKTKEVTNTDSSSKQSLGKVGSYKISPVLGYGTNQYVEISAKAPHFHLVEHGHNKYDFHGNPTGGFVQGKHMMRETVKKHEEQMPKTVSSMVDTLLKEEGLL